MPSVPTLHVRGVPEDLYEAIRERAMRRNASITDEAIRLLQRGIRLEHGSRKAVVESIVAIRPHVTRGPSPAELIREMRGPLPTKRR
ncbi:MAG TPA: hypothetical protein VGB83_01235 [Actinomycetota bacterium]